MTLDGKTALITAAGQGIGRATAEAFASAGARVWASDIDTTKLAGLDVAGAFALDVTDEADVAAAVARTGSVDVLFNCAGYVANGTVMECAPDDWRRSFDINIDGMYRMIRAYLPVMLDQGGGRIINMASVASSIKGIKSRAAYSASKAAVIGLTKSIAVDYVAAGIRCNALCPGTVDTPSLQERIDAYDDPVAARAMFVARQPMGRLASAGEIAGLCVYLASDAADFVTGQTMIIDGGVSI
ncbi:MAG: SDR family oxidoreductase [Alphaproteobacteria bacterium]|jgi:2-keto-3-deoxy-L-fuconate dehydrogenase|nr:SDR family oxidoreductase [Alphaproteobacteria bacterium]MDP6517835.1 SDR family oxidoreductase [Alphaproteobacteria bacterium]